MSDTPAPTAAVDSQADTIKQLDHIQGMLDRGLLLSGLLVAFVTINSWFLITTIDTRVTMVAVAFIGFIIIGAIIYTGHHVIDAIKFAMLAEK